VILDNDVQFLCTLLCLQLQLLDVEFIGVQPHGGASSKHISFSMTQLEQIQSFPHVLDDLTVPLLLRPSV
jgi:hypothetical protein